MKSYSELITMDDFYDRLEYLKLSGFIGDETFGHNRHINQTFYRSRKWRETRNRIIVRDNGNDLGVDEYEIQGHLFVHHINPITVDDILNDADCLYDPENLICASTASHNYIHYGKKPLGLPIVERSMNDTSPWKK